jgi:hypothetical protein
LTFSKLPVFHHSSNFFSNSKFESKWSSIALLFLPVMMIISVHQAPTASSTSICIIGLSIMGNISLGRAFVAGKNLVQNPAAGITHFLIFCIKFK